MKLLVEILDLLAAIIIVMLIGFTGQCLKEHFMVPPIPMGLVSWGFGGGALAWLVLRRRV